MSPKSEIAKLKSDLASARRAATKATNAKEEAQKQAAKLKKAASKKAPAKVPGEKGSGGLGGLADALDSAVPGRGRKPDRGPPEKPASKPEVLKKTGKASYPVKSRSKRQDAAEEEEEEEPDSASEDAVVVPGLRPAGGKGETDASDSSAWVHFGDSGKIRGLKVAAGDVLEVAIPNDDNSTRAGAQGPSSGSGPVTPWTALVSFCPWSVAVPATQLSRPSWRSPSLW